MISTGEPYFAAINGNNEGVQLLQRGNFQGAHRLFVEALKSMKKVTSHERNAPLRTPPSSESSSSLSSSSAVALECHAITYEFKRSSTQLFIYDRAVTIQPADINDNSDCGYEDISAVATPNVNIESAVLLYNTALSSHLLGLESNQSDLLQKAVRFYKIATIVMRRIQQRQSSCAVLELGMINNLGLLYFEFARYTSSTLCFRHLGAQLDYIRRQRKAGRKDCATMQLDFTTYKNLAMNARIQPPTLAPAA